jgi:hypothetical protein
MHNVLAKVSKLVNLHNAIRRATETALWRVINVVTPGIPLATNVNTLALFAAQMIHFNRFQFALPCGTCKVAVFRILPIQRNIELLTYNPPNLHQDASTCASDKERLQENTTT